MRSLQLIGLVCVVGVGALFWSYRPAPPQPPVKVSLKPLATPQQAATAQQQPLQGEPMKTLTDFTPITATQAALTTTKGEIVITLFRDQAPVTTLNFLTLAKSGYYDGIRFHRIIPDFMAQVGDPLTKDEAQKARWGTGGPGYTIPDEFVPELKHDSAGIVSMANVGQPNTGGSQIFLTFEPTPWLDGKHTVFGKISAGMDVLRSLEIGDQIVSITLQ